MRKGGPRPEPAAIAEQKAPVRRRHRHKPVFPTDPGPTITPPTWLKDEGLKIWRRITPNLTVSKLLTAADRETFGRYCRNFARWLKMNAAVDELGEVYSVNTESGTVHRPRPEFLIADRIERQLLATEDRFGLNPAERQRIFAARSQIGLAGDLFGEQSRRPQSSEDNATKPAEPAKPDDTDPVGLLN